MNWEVASSILKTYGPSVLFAVVMGAFLWKVLWPFLVKQIEAYQAVLLKQAVDAQERYEEATKSFVAEMRATHEEFGKQMERRDTLSKQLTAAVAKGFDQQNKHFAELLKRLPEKT